MLQNEQDLNIPYKIVCAPSKQVDVRANPPLLAAWRRFGAFGAKEYPKSNLQRF